MQGPGTGVRFQVGGPQGQLALPWVVHTKTLSRFLPFLVPAGCTVGGTSFKQGQTLAYNSGRS